MTEAENGRRLDVDHIRPWRSFTSKKAANAETNLIALCKICHRSKTSGAERKWLRGDGLAMAAYERSIRLPHLVVSDGKSYINADEAIEWKVSKT